MNLAAYLNWLLANMAGYFFGQWIPDPEKYGTDFALPAMFIGLLVLQILSKKDFFIDLAVAFSSLLIVVAASFFFPGSTGVIGAMVIASAIDGERWK